MSVLVELRTLTPPSPISQTRVNHCLCDYSAVHEEREKNFFLVFLIFLTIGTQKYYVSYTKMTASLCRTTYTPESHVT